MSAAARKFDPANDQHYALSQASQMKLLNAQDGLRALAVMYQSNPDADVPANHYVGALFECVGYVIESVLEHEMVARPRRK